MIYVRFCGGVVHVVLIHWGKTLQKIGDPKKLNCLWIFSLVFLGNKTPRAFPKMPSPNCWSWDFTQPLIEYRWLAGRVPSVLPTSSEMLNEDILIHYTDDSKKPYMYLRFISGSSSFKHFIFIPQTPRRCSPHLTAKKGALWTFFKWRFSTTSISVKPFCGKKHFLP